MAAVEIVVLGSWLVFRLSQEIAAGALIATLANAQHVRTTTTAHANASDL
jgi:hypothetical protein